MLQKLRTKVSGDAAAEVEAFKEQAQDDEALSVSIDSRRKGKANPKLNGSTAWAHADARCLLLQKEFAKTPAIPAKIT